MNCDGCGKAIAGVYGTGSYSCSGCGGEVQVNPGKKKNPGDYRPEDYRSVSLRDTGGRASSIWISGKKGTVAILGGLTHGTEFTVKEFDKFVAAYRKARRELS